MQNLEQIFKKIEEETSKKILEIEQQTKQKMLELEKNYSLLEEQRKKEIEEELNQSFELNKKRIFTENVIAYHRKIEEIKNKIFLDLIDKIKNVILHLDKQDYYNLIKNIIVKNAFPGEKNYIVVDDTNKLKKEEIQKLLSEAKNALKKINPETDLELKEDKNIKFEFGVYILADKKSKKFNLDTIMETLKPYLEQKLNEVFKETIK
ncbi:MAG: hypothetical protein ABDH23_02755 [Endomicrobiia bacterium]